MANTISKPWKFYVFHINNPSGVIININAPNIIQDPPDFLNPNTNEFSVSLRDEFINRQLLTTQQKQANETFKTLLQKAPNVNWKPITESKFEFVISKTTAEQPERQLLGADYAVAWDQDANFYYFLNIIPYRNERGYVVFRGEVDIFVTTGIKFRTGSQNPFQQGHRDRFDTNLAMDKDQLFFEEPELLATPTKSSYTQIYQTLNSAQDYPWLFMLYFQIKGIPFTTQQAFDEGADGIGLAISYPLPYAIGFNSVEKKMRVSFVRKDNNQIKVIEILAPNFNIKGDQYLGRFFTEYLPIRFINAKTSIDSAGYFLIKTNEKAEFATTDGVSYWYTQDFTIPVIDKNTSKTTGFYFNILSKTTGQIYLGIDDFQNEKVFDLGVRDIKLKAPRDEKFEPKLLSPQFTQFSLQHFSGVSVLINYLRSQRLIRFNSNYSPKV